MSAGFAGVLLLTTIMGIAGIKSMQALVDTTHNLHFHPFTVTRSLSQADADIKYIQIKIRNQLLSRSPSTLEETRKEIETLDKQIEQNLDLVNARFLGNKSDIIKLQGLVEEWRRRLGEVIDLLVNEDYQKADQFVVQELTPYTAQINHGMAEVGDFAEKKAQSYMSEANETGRHAVILSSQLLLAVIITGGVLAFFTTRIINRQLRETINQLATSSSEILTTTAQVASGSAETASAVSETTATVEEVKQTVLLASQKAGYVSESAQQTAQAVQVGQQALERMIDGMGGIRAQTAATADAIARLSEQSQAIGEIIASVNDLAEQSNLLAVNAAIEAAKAGEQGKGFTVVAQEIKSLAQQSKQATAQVRAILSDIQKATTAAVMATDLNGKAVEAGVQESAAAGDAIRLLADNISAAARAALQIAASSQQQMVGMDQVALAMENIKQASAQNMAGTRQAEIAARDLHEMGDRLKQLVGKN
jgi:hypothetical protein